MCIFGLVPLKEFLVWNWSCPSTLVPPRKMQLQLQLINNRERLVLQCYHSKIKGHRIYLMTGSTQKVLSMELVPPTWEKLPSTLVPSRKMQLQLQLFHNRGLVGLAALPSCSSHRDTGTRGVSIDWFRPKKFLVWNWSRLLGKNDQIRWSYQGKCSCNCSCFIKGRLQRYYPAAFREQRTLILMKPLKSRTTLSILYLHSSHQV